MKSILLLIAAFLCCLQVVGQSSFQLPVNTSATTLNKAGGLVTFLFQLKGNTITYRGKSHSVVLPPSDEKKEMAFGFLSFTGKGYSDCDYGPFLLIENYGGYPARVFIDKNFNFDLTDDGTPELLTDSLSEVVVSWPLRDLTSSVYSTSIKFIRYQNREQEKMAASLQAQDMPGLEENNFIHHRFWLQENAHRYKIFTAMLGEDSVKMALADVNQNGHYNDAGIDRIVIGDYQTNSIRDKAGANRFTVSDSCILTVGQRAFRLSEVAVNGSYIKLLQTNAQSVAHYNKLDAGQKIPEIIFTDFAGKQGSLSAIVGKNQFTLIDVWGSWCKGCITQTQQLKKVQQQFHDRLTIVGFNYRDELRQAQEYVQNNGIGWQQAIADKEIIDKLQVAAYPFYILVDDKQTIHLYAEPLSVVQQYLQNL